VAESADKAALVTAVDRAAVARVIAAESVAKAAQAIAVDRAAVIAPGPQTVRLAVPAAWAADQAVAAALSRESIAAAARQAVPAVAAAPAGQAAAAAPEALAVGHEAAVVVVQEAVEAAVEGAAGKNRFPAAGFMQKSNECRVAGDKQRVGSRPSTWRASSWRTKRCWQN
jgi:uncharacterized protein YfaQ (DUF2300 family)